MSDSKIKKKFTIWDYVIILSICRKINLKSGLKKEELVSMVQNISDQEAQHVIYYNSYIKQDEIELLIEENFKYHSCTGMVSYLETVNLVSFPVPLTYLGTSLKKNKIITYFCMRGLKYQIPKRTFTNSQTESIYNTGLVIVNAGPGTGKTTASCRRAFHFMNEGVIFISYTNAAVREDKKRMYEYPINNKILFCTIDSLAGKILASTGIVIDHGENSYDHSIRNAISSNMMISGYRHVIIDEAQDVDDLRFELIASLYNAGHFNSLAIFGDPRQQISSRAGNWYKKLWSESESGICILNSKQHQIKRVAFQESRRFLNQDMCDMVNSLSSRRENLHCNLQISNGLINDRNIQRPIIIYNGNINESLDQITSYIKYLNLSGVPFSEFMVLGPSVDASNQTAKIGKIIKSAFRKAELPCKLFSEGSYQANGILFSTIHSAKGKEADYVIMFGMDCYPETFSMIPYDQAESLIYVAHSRARKQIIYVQQRPNIVLPRGILPENVNLVNPGQLLDISEFKKEDDEDDILKSRQFQFNVSALCKDFDYCRLLESNECKVNFQHCNLYYVVNEDLQLIKSMYQDFENEMSNIRENQKENTEIHDGFESISLSDKKTKLILSKLREIKLPKMPERTESPDFYGIMTGVAVGIYCENRLPHIMEKLISQDHKSVSKEEYFKIKMNTYFIDGILLNEDKIVLNKEFEKCIEEIRNFYNKPISELTIEDIYRITVIYIEITSGYEYIHESSYDPNLIPYWKQIADIIKFNFGRVTTEFKIKYNEVVGSVDILTDKYVIELKTKNEVETQDGIQAHLYQCILYNNNRMTILLNLNTRTCHKITSNRNYEYWLYITNKFVEITINQFHLNELISNSDQYFKIDRQNVFCVDTEFNPNLSRERFDSTDQNAIFEISIFNYNDPFRSILQVVNNTGANRNFAISWLEIDEKLYDEAPNILDVIRMFRRVAELYNIKPLLYYYIAKMDVAWSCDIAETHDISNFIADLCLKKGTLINSNKAKLIDYYNSHVDFATFRTHLKHHTALSDTIMLYEIIKTFKKW